ncbi:unnamed protein product, partial [Prorocentrum cordatum]
MARGWIRVVCDGRRAGACCSDVAGAFDWVNSDRLMAELRAVDGPLSKPVLLQDMALQGAVLGPPLWNALHGVAELAASAADFTECVFAGVFNCWKEFDGVVFEATKESMHMLDERRPRGGDFKILSVLFDPKLTMYRAVQEVAREASWRLRALLRSCRFYSTAELFRLFKCRVVSLVNGAAPAIFHATDAVLAPLDGLQGGLQQALGASEAKALCDCSIAPACMRRDLSVL